MRARLVLVAVLAVLSSLIGASPAAATPPASVASVSVAVKADTPPQPRGSYFAPLTVISWTGEDPNASGVVVCLTRGTTPSSDPTYCDVSRDVPAPGNHTGQIKLRPQTSFAIAVFAYTDGSTREYSSSVTAVWHGSTMHSQGAYYLTYGDSAHLSMRLTDVNTKAGLAGEPVRLLYAAPGSDALHPVSTLTTNAQGTVTRSFHPRASGDYFWVFDGGDGHLSASLQMTFYVAYRVTGHLTSSRSAPGQQVQLYGSISPARSDITKVVRLLEYQTSGPCKGVYQLQSEHVTAKRQRLPNGQTTYGYVMSISRTTPGPHKFEAYADGDKRLNGGSSPSVTLTVSGATAGYATRC